jgi:hypothetical protein
MLEGMILLHATRSLITAGKSFREARVDKAELQIDAVC